MNYLTSLPSDYIPVATIRKSNPAYYAQEGIPLPKEPTAKELARMAGLPVRDRDPQSTMEELVQWFQLSASPLVERFVEEHNHLEEEKELERQYASRRSERFRARSETKHLQRACGRVTRHFCGRKLHVWRHEATEPGLYFWRKGNQSFKSWLGSRQMALKTPKQIGGYLASKYPDCDIHIQNRGYMSSSQFVDPSRMAPITVPVYEVFVTQKLPGWYLTAERMLLEGKLLDRERAKELWDAYQKGEMEQQEYAERIATLCRQAEPFDDEPPVGYIDLDEKGRIIERMPEDRPDNHFDDPYKRHEELTKLWDDENEEFDDLEDDRAISLMLGMETIQIETAEESASTTDEFLRAAWTTPKLKTTLQSKGDIDF